MYAPADPIDRLGVELMGVLNVTPDSFSDGGRHLAPDDAVAHGLALVRAGASLVDVGGESTRPRAERVPPQEQIRRTAPVIERLAAAGVAISIDTTWAATARAALDAGAVLVNDVSALRDDPSLAELVAARGARLCLMHMRGTPATMQQDPRYGDVVDDVKAFLAERAAHAVAHGIAPERIVLDPGIGFGKTAAHNLALLRRLPELRALGFPLLVGTSRKRFHAQVAGAVDADQLLAATVASTLAAVRGGAAIVRVHDVGPVRAAVATQAAISGALPSRPAQPPTGASSSSRAEVSTSTTCSRSWSRDQLPADSRPR